MPLIRNMCSEITLWNHNYSPSGTNELNPDSVRQVKGKVWVFVDVYLDNVGVHILWEAETK